MEGSKDAGVFRVMSLAIWSRLKPTDSLAAILAMGKPVALEASAEERETLGFISMIISCKVPVMDQRGAALCTMNQPGRRAGHGNGYIAILTTGSIALQLPDLEIPLHVILMDAKIIACEKHSEQGIL